MSTFFYKQHPVVVTLDSSADTNMMKASTAQYIGANITKSSQVAFQADVAFNSDR